MKFYTALLFAAAFSVSAAHAQTVVPNPAPAAPAAPVDGTPPASGTTMEPALTPAQQANRDRIKGERQTCRTQAQGQGLKGPAMHSAVLDCMAKVDPPVAKRMKCVQAGKSESLAGDDLKKSVHQCMSNT